MSLIMPLQTLQGHTDWVNGVVHLPDGRHILTCSVDGSLRLWDPESGAQVGEDWRYEKDEAGVWSMALSPDGQIVASGHGDGKVKSWDIQTRKVIAKWAGHINIVGALCWSADGSRVASGSWDGLARVWDVKSGETVLIIETGHKRVNTVIYSPDGTKIATGGRDKSAVKIWDAKVGKLFKIIEHDWPVRSLAWTSDGKKLISGSYGPIRIFDTATRQQIAILEGHKYWVNTISLSWSEHLLASVSWDKTARLWNLDTNLPIGPPLQHEDDLYSAALSPDGKVLVTGCTNSNAYKWDIHAIFKEAGLEDQMPIGTNVEASQGDSGILEHTSHSSLSDRSFLEADATRCRDEFGGVDELSPRFFDGMEADVDSSPTGSAHPHSASALLVRLSSFLHRFRSNKAEATELLQPSTPSELHPRMLFAHLFSLVHHSPPENDAATELQQPSTPSRLNPHALLVRLSSLWPRPRLNTDEETSPHPTTPSGLRPDALINVLSSLFHSQSHTNEEIEFSQCSRRPHVVEVAAVRDREVIFTAPPLPQKTHQQSQSDTQGSSTTPPAPGTNSTTPCPRHAHSLPVRMLAHLVLFLCCASPQHANTNRQSTQQHGQPQGQVQAQVSSSQTQPATLSASVTPPAPVTSIAAPGAASA